MAEITVSSFNTDDRDASGWSANAYQSAAHFVYSTENTTPVLKLLDARPGERIVDFGCGSGEVTRQILCAVGDEGEVAGIDSSSAMIAKAKLATKMQDTHMIVGELQSSTLLELLPQHLIGATDKVFTTATLHWCKQNPAAVVENAYKILKPGGLFVGEFGGYGNIAGTLFSLMREALHAALKTQGIDPDDRDPWYFPTPDEYGSILNAEGFKLLGLTLAPRPTPVHNLPDWIRTFAGHNFLQGLDPEVEQAVVNEAVALCKEKSEQDSQGRWSLDYVRLRFTAIKEV
ncbi:S-adenosyl-L-methionine-dependent methyltransferase [Vararia minispora EC-137]|uniref:S-adenosyl-L-methionine-dependent methyltransferase n=1 Tax=Vararia minispora EC-137 TaxID=1314806 RepID=A0ACB8QV52_9AGAM|nr:S-adenosyl-L-methionine-dependent methyltransferase [Vararia minispora EC-137]